MPRRAASVTQADIARGIRAMKAAGYSAVRLIIRDSVVILEPVELTREEACSRRVADRERVVIL